MLTHPKKYLLTAALLLATAGCSKVDLYSNLPEHQVNEMMAVLMMNQISCSKLPGEEEETWKLNVPAADFARAFEILEERGLPGEEFTDMGKVFQKSGLVSSPSEERIRFNHALSQELAKTISEIDGVLSARVHIVLPNNNPLGEEVQPSSAAVFIRHHEDADLEATIPKIKQLVIASIEGLDADKVTVAMFVADNSFENSPAANPGPPLANVLSLTMASESVMRFWAILAVAALLAIAGLAVGVLSWLRGKPAASAGGGA